MGDSLATYLSLDNDSHNNDDNLKKVVVIGQGNVALDCARILAKGASHLYHTDIASHALPLLNHSNSNSNSNHNVNDNGNVSINSISDITIVGRRGHVQGAFTIKELRELSKLQSHDEHIPNIVFHVQEEELQQGMTASTELELQSSQARPKVRIHQLLQKVAAATASTSTSTTASTTASTSSRNDTNIRLRFLLNPVQFLPKANDETCLGAIVCEKTRLVGEPHCQTAVGTGEYETIEADLVRLFLFIYFVYYLVCVLIYYSFIYIFTY